VTLSIVSAFIPYMLKRGSYVIYIFTEEKAGLIYVHEVSTHVLKRNKK